MHCSLGNQAKKIRETGGVVALSVSRRDEFGGITLPSLRTISRSIGADGPALDISQRARCEDKITFWGFVALQRFANALTAGTAGATVATLLISGVLSYEGKHAHAQVALGITAIYVVAGATSILAARLSRRYQDRLIRRAGSETTR